MKLTEKLNEETVRNQEIGGSGWELNPPTAFWAVRRI